MTDLNPITSSSADIHSTKEPSQARKKDFGNRVVARAKELGFDQAGLSRAAGINPRLINTYWHGHRIPMPDKLGALAQALAVDPIWLATGQTDDGLGPLKTPVGTSEWVLIPYFPFDEVPEHGGAIGAKPREIPVRRAWLDRLGTPRVSYWSTDMPVHGLRGLADAGDLLICDYPPEQLSDGHSYIFMMHQTRIVRRAVMMPDGIALVGDDASQVPVPLPAGAKYGHLPNASCIGRIMGVYKMTQV